MSHFAVVIGDDVEGQLAPYDEGISVEPYVSEDDQEVIAKEVAQALARLIEQAEKPAQEQIKERRHDNYEVITQMGHDPAKYKRAVIFYNEQIEANNKLEADCWLLNNYWSDGYEVRDGKIVETTTYNPKSQWDWWTIGGRWNGFFDLKPDEDAPAPSPHWSEIQAEQRPLPTYEDHVAAAKREGRPTLSREEWDKVQERNRSPYATLEDYLNAKRGTSDQPLKGQVDFKFAREKARVQAEEEFDKMLEVTEGIEYGINWEAVLADHGIDQKANSHEREGFKEQLERAREVYGAQPWVAAIRSMEEYRFMWGSTPHEHFRIEEENPRQAFVTAAVNRAFVPYAIVKDGEWISKGKMGWFGMSNDEVPQDVWNQKVAELYDSLPDDTQLTMVDCHV